MEQLAGIFGLQWQELVLILIIVLVIFGPSQLPKLGRLLGGTVKDVRDAASNMSDAVEDEQKPRAKSSARIRQDGEDSRNKAARARDKEA